METFRRFFAVILEQCQQAGLVWGKELYRDSTEVQANAAYRSLTPRFAVEAREATKAVEAHLTALFADLADSADSSPDRSDAASSPSNSSLPPPHPSSLPVEPTLLPVRLTVEQREDLVAANAARHDWIAALGAQDRRENGSWYRRLADFQVSTTDPDAAPMHTKGPVDMGSRTHFVVDGGKERVIQTVLVTPPSEVMDNQPMLDLLWRTHVSAASRTLTS